MSLLSLLITLSESKSSFLSKELHTDHTVMGYFVVSTTTSSFSYYSLVHVSPQRFSARLWVELHTTWSLSWNKPYRVQTSLLFSTLSLLEGWPFFFPPGDLRWREPWLPWGSSGSGIVLMALVLKLELFWTWHTTVKRGFVIPCNLKYHHHSFPYI